MAEEQQPSVGRAFPVKPKLKPPSKKSSSTPEESKYWKSFKPHPTQALISSITSLSFSPSSPHDFAATHSATVTIFSAQTLEPKSTISGFSDTTTSASFRSDGRLLAAGSYSGVVQVFDVKSRTSLRHLRGHSRPVHLVRYPRHDKLHLFTGGDDAVVKYWDVVSGTSYLELLGHKDYVRCGDGSPARDDMFVTGSYDHSIRVWDVRVSSGSSVMELNHGKPVEDVVFLPSGGLIATAGASSVKIWDVIGGGKLLYSMESHNKTVTSICVGKIGKDSGEEAQQYRILSVSLDGYMKVFDYAKFKITHSMRFPSPLLSVGFSPDCSTRVIGTSNGIIYAGRRKMKENVGLGLRDPGVLGPIGEPPKRVLRPSYFRYFHRGQNEKPSEGDFLIMRPKKVKLAEHDKLLKKFRHKEALVSALRCKNPESVVAVMEELVARKKLLRCVSNLETEELGLLLGFLARYSTMPRYAGLLMRLALKVLEMRAEDVRNSDLLKSHIRNLKRSRKGSSNSVNSHFEIIAKVSGSEEIPSVNSSCRDFENSNVMDKDVVLQLKSLDPVDSVLLSLPGKSDEEGMNEDICQESITSANLKLSSSGHTDIEDQQHLTKVENVDDSPELNSQFPLPPPLPKSPSESWLWRTLPSMSSRKSSSHSYLGTRIKSPHLASKMPRSILKTKFQHQP